MATVLKYSGLVALILLVIVAVKLFMPSTAFGAVSGLLAENYIPYVSENGGYNSNYPIKTSSTITAAAGFFQTLTGGTNVLQGNTLVQNLVQSAFGYSTTTAGSGTLTPAQFCAGTADLIPVGTAAVTITLPNATTTFAACGASYGAWSWQIVDNESSNNVTIATSTGGSAFRFMTQGTSTPVFGSGGITIPASSTVYFVGQYVASSSGAAPTTAALNMYLQEFTHPYAVNSNS